MNPSDAGTTRLFLDDRWIEDSAFVTRAWHQPRRLAEPVLQADRVWEERCPVLYGTVLKREQRWQMWYCAWTRHCAPRACYAESDDGVTWRKPELGVVPFGGSSANNIVLVSRSDSGLIDDLTVIDDPDDTDRPLKMLYYDRGGKGVQGGIYAAASRDGIHWELLSEGPVLRWGDRFNAVPVRIDGSFVVFGRAAAMAQAGRGRCVYRSESEDLVHWSVPERVFARDVEDPPDLEIYSLAAFPYADMLLGAVERMYMSPDVLDPELVWSHDGGRIWCRSRPRPAFIERAPNPSWQDSWINLSASVPVVVGEQLWFYYSGRGGAHMSPFPLNQGAIGLSCLRRGGFCSLQAGQRPGWFVTPSFVWPGGDLVLNMDPRLDRRAHPRYTHGQVTVCVQNDQGVALPGYAHGDCTALTANTVNLPGCAAPVVWGERSADRLTGIAVKLEFRLREAHVYSFSSRRSG